MDGKFKIMRILLINQHFVSPEEPGFTRHYEMARYLVDKGHNFTIVASDLNYQTGQRVSTRKGIVSREDIEGIEILRTYILPSLHKNFFWRVLSFLSFMFTSTWSALRAHNVDLVIGTSPPLFQAVSAWLIAFLRRKPFLLEIRDLWPDDAIDMGVLTNPIFIGLARWLEHFLYKRASHILVNSPAYRDYLLEKGISSDKVSFIAYGADIEMFKPEVNGHDVRKSFCPDNCIMVTYAGALGLANDIYTLLEAANHLRGHPEIKIVLFGDGKERRNLEKKAKDLDLTNVKFAGAMPKTSMPEVLAASDICVAILQNIRMFRTTYPNKVFDYLASGKPVVLAIDGVIRNVVDEAQAGIFVQPGNGKALAQAILELSTSPDRRKCMGEAGRKFVVKNFDRRQQLALLIALFEAVAWQR